MANPGQASVQDLKELRSKCCLCNDICKWLDSRLDSDKGDKTVGPISQPFNAHNSVGHKRTHTLLTMSGAWSSWCCHQFSVIHHGLGDKFSATIATISYSKIQG